MKVLLKACFQKKHVAWPAPVTLGLGNEFVFLMLEVHTGDDLPDLSGFTV